MNSMDKAAMERARRRAELEQMETVKGLEGCKIRTELIPDHVREDIGRVGLEACIRYYQNPENVKRYEEWLVEYRKREQRAKCEANC